MLLEETKVFQTFEIAMLKQENSHNSRLEPLNKKVKALYFYHFKSLGPASTGNKFCCRDQFCTLSTNLLEI